MSISLTTEYGFHPDFPPFPNAFSKYGYSEIDDAILRVYMGPQIPRSHFANLQSTQALTELDRPSYVTRIPGDVQYSSEYPAVIVPCFQAERFLAHFGEKPYPISVNDFVFWNTFLDKSIDVNEKPIILAHQFDNPLRPILLEPKPLQPLLDELANEPQILKEQFVKLYLIFGTNDVKMLNRLHDGLCKTTGVDDPEILNSMLDQMCLAYGVGDRDFLTRVLDDLSDHPQIVNKLLELSLEAKPKQQTAFVSEGDVRKLYKLSSGNSSPWAVMDKQKGPLFYVYSQTDFSCSVNPCRPDFFPWKDIQPKFEK